MAGFKRGLGQFSAPQAGLKCTIKINYLGTDTCHGFEDSQVSRELSYHYHHHHKLMHVII